MTQEFHSQNLHLNEVDTYIYYFFKNQLNSISSRMDINTVVYSYYGILFTNEYEQTTTSGNRMDESRNNFEGRKLDPNVQTV